MLRGPLEHTPLGIFLALSLGMTDRKIKNEIRRALDNNADLEASDVAVDVRNGVVTLSGKVSSQKERILAEGCLDRLMGVKKIVNNIEILGPV